MTRVFKDNSNMKISIKEMKGRFVRLHQLTHCGAKQFPPIRFEIEDHAPPGPWQSGPTDEQHQEDQIGKGSSHPNHLMQKRGIRKQFIFLLINQNHRMFFSLFSSAVVLTKTIKQTLTCKIGGTPL